MLRLRSRVSVMRPTAELDEYGQQVPVWMYVANRVPADVRVIARPGHNSERVRGMALESQLALSVAVRYQRSLDDPMQADGWRVVLHGNKPRILNITAAHNQSEEGRWIMFDCTEGSLDGN